jgi:hypothetical protein
MWIEHHGDVDITNLNTGERCVVTFEKAGFFDDKANTTVKGYITNKEGKKMYVILIGFTVTSLSLSFIL